LRSLQRVGYATVDIEIRGIPPFAKNAKDGAPGDLLHSLPRTRNARFIPRGSATPVDDFKESRMKFADPTKSDRKSGGSVVEGSAVSPLVLLRGIYCWWGRVRVGFWSKKLTGRIRKSCQSVGMTGQSSRRTTWWKPSVYQATMSVFSIERFAFVHSGSP